MPRPVSNPPNPYLAEHVDWEGAPPPADLELYEEETGTALAKNDSPDVGFTWSCNPYRGCWHACSYCSSGDTRILMADGRTTPLAELRVGDAIYGTVRRGRYRRYVTTRVLAHWATRKPAFIVALADGTEIVASGDHRFLSRRGWKHVIGAEQGPMQRPHLTTNDVLFGVGRIAVAPPKSEGYRRGYLTGMVRGDGLLATYSYNGRRRGRDVQHHFRLALVDLEPLQRARDYLAGLGVATHEHVFQQAVGDRQALSSIRTNAQAGVERIRELIAWPQAPSLDWRKGFLAGIFDAEGSCSDSLRIFNTDPAIIDQTTRAMRSLGFDTVEEVRPGTNRPVHVVRLTGGLPERMRFFQTVDPAITRKRSIEGLALKRPAHAQLRVVAIEPLPRPMELFDITTGTGDFIAEGVVSHNCYARPSHQYLGFGAGTDFERKIVVKTNVAARLREDFEKPRWKGEVIAFSGNTDCYQPIEAVYELTRKCLEVCLEYRNPVAVITKSKLVRRDVELLAALHREASCRVAVSIPFKDDETARKIEPYASSASKRFETLRLLSEAGIPTTLALAPVIPGLNDCDIPELLERARDAGARSAFMVLLRLPREVLPVFDERLEQAFPLRAAKIRNAIKSVRGGRMYKSGFGERMSGEGERWAVIEQLFTTHRRRLGLQPREDEPDPPATFRRPTPQLTLF